MSNINNRLKISIKNSGYTQKEIANLINTSENTLSSYTRGKASIPVETLKEICNITNASITWIIYGKDETNLNNDELNIINKIKFLNKDNMIRLDGYIDSLIDKQVKNTNLSISMNIEEKEENKKSS